MLVHQTINNCSLNKSAYAAIFADLASHVVDYNAYPKNVNVKNTSHTIHIVELFF